MRKKTSIPSLSLLDRRLHPTDHLVLGALCYLSDEHTNIAICKRKTVAELIGIHETHVSRSTARLVEFGWVLKNGAGRGTRYYINWTNEQAKTIAESATVDTDQTGETIAESATVGTGQTDQTGETGETVAESATVGTGQTGETVAESATVGTGQTGETVAESATVTPVRENQPATICSNKYLYISRSIFDHDKDHDQIITTDFASQVFKHYFKNFTGFPAVAMALVSQWVSSKITKGGLISACERTEGMTINSPVFYVNKILVNDLTSAPTKQKTSRSKPIRPEDIEKQATRMGMSAKPGESWDAFRHRVHAAMDCL